MADKAAAKEAEAIVTVTSMGRVTIPAALRKALEIRTGDRLEFDVDGQRLPVAKRRRASPHDLRGLIMPGAHATIDRWIEEARTTRAECALGRRDVEDDGL